MVQLKYFGDSRDYFKYDLIQTILEKSPLHHYVFVPMLTEHRDDNEGKKVPVDRGDKSQDLLALIKGCGCKSLKHWERWLATCARSYLTVEPVDQTFFCDAARASYWQKFTPLLRKDNALVFVDPDTGLQTGTPRYRQEMGPEKYILDGELGALIETIPSSSVLMIYQHLPNNKHIHVQSVEKKLTQVRRVNSAACVCAYREDDLAFLFVSKGQDLHQEVRSVLRGYHDGSSHPLKSLHG